MNAFKDRQATTFERKEDTSQGEIRLYHWTLGEGGVEK